jgi:hypothetical protein
MTSRLDISKYGQTQVACTRPWGLSVRKGTRLLCADGKVRAVAYLADTPDTFFSTPAAIVVHRDGKRHYVTGYMTVEECSLKDDGYKTERRAYVFRHHNGNEHLLPSWPDSFTREKFDLLSVGEEIHRP